MNVKEKGVDIFSLSPGTLILALFFLLTLIPATIYCILRAKRNYDQHDHEF